MLESNRPVARIFTRAPSIQVPYTARHGTTRNAPEDVVGTLSLEGTGTRLIQSKQTHQQKGAPPKHEITEHKHQQQAHHTGETLRVVPMTMPTASSSMPSSSSSSRLPRSDAASRRRALCAPFGQAPLAARRSASPNPQEAVAAAARSKPPRGPAAVW